MNPLTTDQQFFDSLIASDISALDRILVDDFLIIDVMSGAEFQKSDFMAAMSSGLLKFDSIEVFENRVRIYEKTAVITGRTRMKGQLGVAPFAASSRYAHVYIEQESEWRMGSAQGTPITI